MNKMLFTYGTLRDTDIQKALFGQELRMKRAVITDWSVFIGYDGYLFAKPDHGGRIEGYLLSLSAEQLLLADKWEEVPMYLPEEVSCVTEDGKQETAWIYAKRHAEGTPYHGNGSSALDKASVLQEISQLKAQLS